MWPKKGHTLIVENVNSAKAKEIFRVELTDQVADGWHIEIENEYEAVLSKKKTINWILHILIILVSLFLFAPFTLFWVFVMILLAVTKGSKTKRVWIDPEGQLHSE